MVVASGMVVAAIVATIVARGITVATIPVVATVASALWRRGWWWIFLERSFPPMHQRLGSEPTQIRHPAPFHACKRRRRISYEQRNPKRSERRVHERARDQTGGDANPRAHPRRKAFCRDKQNVGSGRKRQYHRDEQKRDCRRDVHCARVRLRGSANAPLGLSPRRGGTA